MSGRPRIGKRIEFLNGKIITHMGAGNTCGCFAIKNGWDKPSSITWCRCCQGTLYSIYQFVFPHKVCHMDIIETHATEQAAAIVCSLLGILISKLIKSALMYNSWNDPMQMETDAKKAYTCI